MTWFKIPFIFLLFILLFSHSCTSTDRSYDYVYYRLNANPTTLDPALITDVPGASIAAKFFNGLVKLNGDLGVAPDIAERWEMSKDGLSYRFFLKRGIRFSGGREVRAGDFKFSFERILDPQTKSPDIWVFDKVEGVKEFREKKAGEVTGFKVIGDYTFEIRLKRPFSPFLSMLTMTPAYVVPQEDVKKWGMDFSSHPSGTGPFVLRKWLPNRELILDKREGCFEGDVKVKGIVYRIIPEDLTAITEFELGNIDVISLPASAYSKFKKDEKWNKHIVSLNGLNTYYLGLNSSKPPFDKAYLRKAVSYAIDRKKILDTFYEGRGRLAMGPVPDPLRKWDLDAEVKELYGYNPARAKEIIRKEGISGIKVTLYITADQDVVDLAEIIQSYLADAGIAVNIKQLEWSAYKEAINKGEPDMFWLSWWADYPDAENFLFPLFHSSNFGPAGNRTRYANKEVDALIEKGRYSLNEKERVRSYKKAEEIIIKDAPWVSFWHRTDFLVKQPWIKGYKVYPIYSMDKGTGIEITGKR
ncbi:MAG: ABC transporter substrate-binding protein [Nitrospirae bacterium]|nr:ABC transporter substrate-binding protein [Nitrospirota bacterium]MCL5238233.1 ABC transporter substrate-binding protein [Nitrospirota bacterium]